MGWGGAGGREGGGKGVRGLGPRERERESDGGMSAKSQTVTGETGDVTPACVFINR